jgi:hypothetical protein
MRNAGTGGMDGLRTGRGKHDHGKSGTGKTKTPTLTGRGIDGSDGTGPGQEVLNVRQTEMGAHDIQVKQMDNLLLRSANIASEVGVDLLKHIGQVVEGSPADTAMTRRP